MNNLEQIEKIKVLQARYCRFVDTKQWDKLSSLLAEDIHMVFKDPKDELMYEFKSSKEMIDLMDQMISTATTVHHVHNPEIEILSDKEATAIWALEDIIIIPDGVEAPFKTMHGYGHYYQKLEKVGDEWIIKSFTLKRLKLDYTYAK